VPPNPDFANVASDYIPHCTASKYDRAPQPSSMAASHSWNQVKFNASFNDYNHSEFATAQDASGVPIRRQPISRSASSIGVLQLQHQPLGKLQGTLGL